MSTKPKVSWRHSLGNLYTKAYFESCKGPQDFNYEDFLIWSKSHKMDKSKVRKEWSVARKYLAKSRHQSLREAGTRLDSAWKAGLHTEYETKFFKEQQALQMLEENRRTLHTVVDKVITKRQLIEYEDEEIYLTKRFHPEDGGNSKEEANVSTPLKRTQETWSDEEDVHPATPDRLQYSDEVPLVEDLHALFHHDDVASEFTLSDKDQALYKEATKWFKAKLGRDTESTIRELRNERFKEPWVHDLLYDRLKLLRTGIDPHSDENTYTSFWIMPDFVALQTGIPGLISKGFANENHFTPSAWRRALSRGTKFAKGTSVDAYYVARDNCVSIIFENIGSPSCTNHSKYNDDIEKSCRNAADALLEHFYNSTGSFEIAKNYSVIFVIVFGPEVAIYTTNIKSRNEYKVSKVFQGRYHFSKDVYLANLLFHVKFCLTIKTIMERNMDVSVKFGNTIESLPINEQAHHNLRLHTTPVAERISRRSLKS